ncbi:MAG: hypothetical protein WC325_01335 [Candidatus Bathyarchaeia archaeon]
MNKTLMALILVGALLSMLFTITQTVKAAPHTADGQAFPIASPLTVTSPSNTTYSPQRLTLNVTFKLMLSPECAKLTYTIDGKNENTIPLEAIHESVQTTRTYANGTTVITNATFFVPFTITGCTDLPELSEGTHNITVSAEYQANDKVGLDSTTVYFAVNPDSEQNLPEFPTWTPLAVIATVFIAVIGVYRRKLTTPER